MKGFSLAWEQEKERRLNALRCPICIGLNPYVCECAKQAYLKMYEDAKPSPSKKSATKVSQEEERLEQEWASHKGLICSPSMIECNVCKTGEWKDFCECAKKKWMKWKKAGGWDSPAPSFGQGDGGMGPWNYVEPLRGSTKEEELETKWNQRVSTGPSLCAICSTCGGSSISTCECAKRRWMEEERKKI